MPEALNIAVVGHANTGKTSLLRTLTRDVSFGEVADSAGTTRRVQGARLRVDDGAEVVWFDTPGMEDSIALLEYIEQLAGPRRLDGPDRIRLFLDAPEAHRRFEQEARVLAKVLDCDAALYVIDARDPVLGKHRDELALLAACGKPILPVLNFVHAPAHRADDWRAAMARLGLHALLEFDTVAPPLDGEQQMYGRLAVLLDRQAATLAQLAEGLGRQRAARHDAACRTAAELLVDVAALHIAAPNQPDAIADATRALQDKTRQREQACVQALLALYNFRAQDYAAGMLPLAGPRWGMDLFHPQALKEAGVRVGVGMAAGAMAGATVDLLLAGISLGTAAIIGAAAGGMWQGIDRFGKRLGGKLRGYREFSVDDAVLRLLALRQRALIEALERRGHAARDPLTLDAAQDDEAWRASALPTELKEARSKPEWSALGAEYQDAPRRTAVVLQLARRLQGNEA